MARPREFDTTVVLDRAVDLFWRQGYEATSLADLTEHLGIGRASLYSCFGSKHGLYVRALQHYVETRDPSIIEILSQSGPVLPAVRTVLEAAINSPAAANDATPRGCLITNAAAECAADDASVRSWLEVSWSELETVLTSALVRAQCQGEIGADKSPKSSARLLVVLLQGLQVMDRGGCGDARRRDAVDVALAALN